MLRRNAHYADEIRDPVHENARLAAPGAGDHEQGLVRRGYGLTLRVVQRFEDGGYVHDKNGSAKVAQSSRERPRPSGLVRPIRNDRFPGPIQIRSNGGVNYLGKKEY